MTSPKTVEVIIIGAGPAGITAAIQLQRYGIPFLLIEKEHIGGLLWNANLVENYPGFPNGVTGPKLVSLMQKQMERLGIQVLKEEVTEIDLDGSNFAVITKQAKRKAKFLIVATGTKAKSIPLPIPESARGRVFSEVWPLLDEQNKQIVIVGAGDAAFDYALNLAKKRNFVTILNHGGDVKCLGLLKERAAAETNIAYRPQIAIIEVKADRTATKLQIRCDASSKDESLEADYLLFAIGRNPQLDFLSKEIHEQESTLTDSRRLYFVGDVKNGLLRQTAIAAGDGLRAAMQIHQMLKENV